jgi:hypothetical protein
MVPRRRLRLHQGTLGAVASCNPELQAQFANPDKLSTTGRRTSYLKMKRTSEFPYPGYIAVGDYKEALSCIATEGLYCIAHSRTSP